MYAVREDGGLGNEKSYDLTWLNIEDNSDLNTSDESYMSDESDDEGDKLGR